MAEGEVLRDAIGIGGVHDGGLAEAAAAFGVFRLRKVPAAGGEADGFAGGGDFEPFGNGFPGFDAFGTSHKFYFNSKRARNIGFYFRRGKREIFFQRFVTADWC
jgi:hypothetical protein